MRLKQLELLLALEKYNTYINAANKIGMSQSAISTAVKELEKELGFKILNRTKTGSIFTSKGRMVLLEAHEITATMKDIFDIKDAFTGEISGHYYLAGASHSCNLQITDMMIQLQKDYPGLKMSFADKDNYEILQGVIQGDYLAGMLQISNIDETLYQSEIARYHLGFQTSFAEKMVFLIGPKHPFYDVESAALEEILQQSVILTRYRMSEVFDRFFEEHGYNKKINLIHDLFTTRILIEKSAHYISFLPYRFAVKSIQDYKDKLKILEISDYNWISKVGWIYKKEKITWKEQQVLQLLQKYWQHSANE